MTATARFVRPPFKITRMSHVRLTVRDLDKACAFYTKLAGLVVTKVEDGVAYLRGVEEVCHHSLVLRQSKDDPTCDSIGLRVLEDSDLDDAKAYFDSKKVDASWVKRPYEARTLLVRHSSGIPIELVARMDTVPRVLTAYGSHIGARSLRLDHCQIIVPDVDAIGDDFLDMGFRASEMIMQTETGKRMGIFLHRKSNPHDIVLAYGAGPRLHHFAYVTTDLQAMIRACDLAGEMGLGEDVERGPGRHGPGNGMFVYFRDRDGHRIELILAPMQMIDLEEETRVWSSADKNMIVPWGPSATQRWREEASLFTDVPLTDSGNIARWVSR